MDKRPIGMFDSGLGGLNVLKEIRKKLPGEKIIYLGDTNRFPYGSKSKDTIIEISRQNIKFLIKQNVKVIIIACGTATSQALDVLSKEFDIPIIGIINPTVDYIKKNINGKKKIGIIATKGTIKSKVWEKTILEKIENVDVISEPAPLLATMAEEGWTSNKVAEYTIREYMKLFKNVDILILGCTHYPLFKELIKNELDEKVEIIDTGNKLSNYLYEYLNNNDMLNCLDKFEYKIYLTDIETNFAKLASSILEEKVYNKDIEKIEL